MIPGPNPYRSLPYQPPPARGGLLRRALRTAESFLGPRIYAWQWVRRAMGGRWVRLGLHHDDGAVYSVGEEHPMVPWRTTQTCPHEGFVRVAFQINAEAVIRIRFSGGAVTTTRSPLPIDEAVVLAPGESLPTRPVRGVGIEYSPEDVTLGERRPLVCDCEVWPSVAGEGSAREELSP